MIFSNHWVGHVTMCISTTSALLKVTLLERQSLKQVIFLGFLDPPHTKIKCHLAFIIVNSEDFVMPNPGDGAGSAEPR